jgi:hypothetical protein
MRVAILALAALATLTVPGAAQQRIEYPWCANYSGGSDAGGGSNCGFTSFAQCLETLRGMGGFCDPNPFYQRSSPAPARRSHKRQNG